MLRASAAVENCFAARGDKLDVDTVRPEAAVLPVLNERHNLTAEAVGPKAACPVALRDRGANLPGPASGRILCVV
jgi:hypothetical protein